MYLEVNKRNVEDEADDYEDDGEDELDLWINHDWNDDDEECREKNKYRND